MPQRRAEPGACKCGKPTKSGRKECDTCRSRTFREANPAYHRDHMRARPEEVRAKYAEGFAVRQRRNQEAVNAAKSGPCVDCGGSFPLECMDLDHVPERGPKKFALSKLGARRLEAVQAEIGKCDLVCSNCHRIRTDTRSGGKGPAC